MNELQALIIAEIDQNGPMPLSRYMSLCLSHPQHGYYMTKEPFGVSGDFTTAPEISQMFGELIGLWIGDLWTRQGKPSGPILAELGPGRGTLMADALRALQKVPDWPDAPVHFVETSPRLRAIQAQAHPGVTWHDTAETLPDDGPLYIVANELFDALPIDQWVRTERGWAEQSVTHADTDLQFTLKDVAEHPNLPSDAAPGDTYERCPIGERLCSQLASQVMKAGGAALIIDYGYTSQAAGDSLQAMKNHSYADPLNDPGEADLTAHVNFGALAGAGRTAGATIYGPATQNLFLGQLGLPLRARALGGTALRDAARLMDTAAMGDLFKVLAIAPPTSPPPAGFAP
ncbi:MAG: SAM-dependent methyltransferase [Pseudomonadota bacterium]